jgi:hypothetical protein
MGITATLSQLTKALDPYPFAYQYLLDKRDGFTPEGIPHVKLPPPPSYQTEMSFAGYQQAMLRSGQIGKFLGLQEELPGLATQSVTEALPAKGRANRFYRLVVHSEAMK